MQKENNPVPPPWGDDMEEALMAQAEAIRKNTTSVPCRRCGFDLLRCVSWTKLGLIAILLLWFLLALATGHSHAAGHKVIRKNLEQSAR